MRFGEGFALLFLFLTFSLIKAPLVEANYGPIPPIMPSDPIERASNYLDSVSEAVSSWTISSMEEHYVDLDDIYQYYEQNDESSRFLRDVQNTLTSLDNLDIAFDQKSLEIVYDGWEAVSYIKERDLALSEFDTYMANELLNYPTNEWMKENVIPETIKKIFMPDSQIDFGVFINIVEEVRSDIENGIPVEDVLYGATIELLEYSHLGEYDPVNRVLAIQLNDERLGKALFVWDNGILAVDVADVASLPMELRAKVDPDFEAGCLKIDIEKVMLDIATIPIVELLLEIKIKAGFSGEVLIKPDAETSIDKQIEVSIKGVHIGGELEILGTGVAEAELSYHIDEDTISAVAETEGEPVWSHYDTSTNTWTAMKSYFVETKGLSYGGYGGYLVVSADDFSIYSIMSSRDPALKTGSELIVILIIIGVATVVAAGTIGLVLNRRKKRGAQQENVDQVERV